MRSCQLCRKLGACQSLYGENKNFSVHEDPHDATTGADALVLVTEWKLYWVPDFDRLANEMRQKILVDGRNIWSGEAAMERGFTYHAIGRPSEKLYRPQELPHRYLNKISFSPIF
jgi:UDPglucose 6-dehydrogenase